MTRPGSGQYLTASLLFTTHRPRTELFLSFSGHLSFPKSFLRHSRVSMAGVMHPGINDADKVLYFVNPERHKLLVSGRLTDLEAFNVQR